MSYDVIMVRTCFKVNVIVVNIYTYVIYLMYGKCSKISNTFLFLFSNKMLDFQDWHSQNACQSNKQRKTPVRQLLHSVLGGSVLFV